MKTNRSRRGASTTCLRSAAWGTLFATGVIFAAACAKNYGGPLATSHTPVGVSVSADAGPTEPKTGALTLIAQLKEKAIGPMVARGPSSALAAYIATPEKDKSPRAVVVIPLGIDGKPKSDPKTIAQAGPETTALALKAIPGGTMLLWTSLTERGEGLYGVVVDENGVAASTPAELTRSVEDIVWMDVVPTTKGAIAVWAEETTGNLADVLTLAVDEKGRPRGVPARVARGVTAWQAVRTKSGVGLALVRPSASITPKQPASASLHYVSIDDSGRPSGEAALIATRATAGAFADFDAATSGDTVAFAWTESGMEASVAIAGVDTQGKVMAPVNVAPDRGGASFAAIAANDSGYVVAWEEPKKRDRSTKRAHFTLLDGTFKVQRESTLELAGGSTFELSGAGAGFALLGMGPPCLPAQARESCLATANAPIFVRFDALLAPTQVEGLVGDERPSLAWDLDCVGDACLALAAAGTAPTNVYGVNLVVRPSTHRALWLPPPPEDAPRLTAVSTLEAGTSISDVAVAHVGAIDLVTTITAAADDGKGIAGSTLVVRPSDGPKVVLSTKALAMGGIAITAAAKEEDGAVIAWVARENGDPEVHLTRVDKKGKKQNDVQLTTSKGDASDVSIITIDGGYFVAWVDGRDGQGEVYAARVDLQLQRQSREERITTATGDATDTALLPLGGDAILLAWADPRESPKDGFSDIYTAVLSAKSGKKASTETRILSTAAHSRSPVLAKADGGATLGWIEEAESARATNEARGAMVVSLDQAGKPASEPQKLRLAREGIVTALVLDSSSGVLHAVAARSTADELCLDALGTKEQMPLLCLDGPPSLDIAMSLFGTTLYFGDDGPETTDQRLRRAIIDWRK
ncbi:hypothetical protein BH09MYX1_BH09MYX1_37950 [soil metagenome]